MAKIAIGAVILAFAAWVGYSMFGTAAKCQCELDNMLIDSERGMFSFSI